MRKEKEYGRQRFLKENIQERKGERNGTKRENMRKVIAILMTLAMLLSAAMAEEAPEAAAAPAANAVQIAAHYDYDELVVGATMPMYGAFTLDCWGNSSSDMDVRKLINGYNLVEWTAADSGFRLDSAVVTNGSIVTKDQAGNHIYNLTLYGDLRYSDGTPITAWDYAFSWLLRSSPLIDALGGTSLKAEYIDGWKEYAAGETPYLAGVRVTGDRYLQVRISAEYLPFFYEVGLLDCYPLPIHVIAPGCEVADDGEGAYIRNINEKVVEPLFTEELLRQTLLDEANGYLTHPATVSGAYRLLSFDGAEARFELNPEYKGNADGEKPAIPRIVFRVAEPDTMVDDLLQGRFGLLNKVMRADVIRDGMNRAVRGGNYTQATYPRRGLSFITFNGERSATADPAVRKAIALCLNKEALTDEYAGEFGIEADGFYGLGQWMFQIVNGTQAPVIDEKLSEAEQEKERQAWESVTLDGVEAYRFDTARAAEILNKAGWKLNREGKAYDRAKDDVRCREIDGELVPLELKLVYPETTRIGEALNTFLAEPLKEAGIALTVEPSDSVLAMYYGQAEPEYDMLFLATNFDIVFDPTALFAEGSPVNVHGVKDEELLKLAGDMRRTESGDLRTYCTKWVRFLEQFAETEPMIPVYSNIYYDFHTRLLRDYEINEASTWSEAVVGSFFSDVPEGAEEGE